MKKRVIVIICSVILIFASILCLMLYLHNREPQVISDLAKHGDNIVYVLEDGNYVPFIVASNDYGGNVLLVREEVLPTPRRINEYYSYYQNSEIDNYLNTGYLNTIANNDQIALSRILITREDEIGFAGTGVKSIERKVFLLSLTEIGVKGNSNAGAEGETIPYFKDPEKRIVYYNGKPSSWWLRSPQTSYQSCTFVIGSDGTIDSGNSSDENRIRPAFAVPRNLPVTKSAYVIAGQTVYVFSKEN